MNPAQMKAMGKYWNAVFAKGTEQSNILFLVFIWWFPLVPAKCSVVTGYCITVCPSPKAGAIMFNIWMN